MKVWIDCDEPGCFFVHTDQPEWYSSGEEWYSDGCRVLREAEVAAIGVALPPAGECYEYEVSLKKTGELKR